MPITVSGLERLAGEVLSMYEQAEEVMMNRMAGHLAKGTSSDNWTQKKYAEAHAVNKEMRKVVSDLGKGRSAMTSDFVKTAWSESSQAFVTEASKVAELFGIAQLSPNSSKVISIISELDKSLKAEDRVILRKVNDAYADIVGRASAKVATGSITYKQAVKEELEAFAKKGISGFIDKNGHAWDMATYAEMATLTAIERATLYGYVDTMQEYGYDLAIISSHAGACPLCAAWEDVIVSVSGNNKDYPSLDDAEADGVFHPRCLHTIYTYYEGITEGGRDHPRSVESPKSEYTARQRQRYFERKIREWKRMMAVATNPYDERVAYAHVRQYQSRVRSHIKNYGGSSNDRLERKYWREGGRQNLSTAAKVLKPVVLK